MLPIDQLIRGFEAEEARELCFDILEDVGLPARRWRTGGVLHTALGGLATGLSVASKVIAGGIRANFLEWAEGDWLTILAQQVYGVVRVPASYASGHVTLTNEGGGVYNLAAGELIVRSGRTGARYRVTEPVALGAHAQQTVGVESFEAGSLANSEPGAINELETPLLGVTVGNAAAVVGADAESDERLRRRCAMARAQTSSFGPRDIYEFAALSATLPGGAPVAVSRVRVTTPTLGAVWVYCATPAGAPTAAELTAVRESIERLARVDTDAVFVEAVAERPVSRTLTIWHRGGDVELIRQRSQQALAKLFAEYPIGGISKYAGGTGHLYADAVKAAVMAANPGVVFDVDGMEADVTLASHEVAVLAATLEVRGQ